MVLTETIRVKSSSNLRIRRIRGVNNKEKRISLDVIVYLHVIDVAEGIPISV